MMKNVHCNKSAQSSAEQREDKQRHFTDSEFAVNRLFLVDAENGKCDYVNYNEPYAKIFHEIFLDFIKFEPCRCG